MRDSALFSYLMIKVEKCRLKTLKNAGQKFRKIAAKKSEKRVLKILKNVDFILHTEEKIHIMRVRLLVIRQLKKIYVVPITALKD